MQSLKVSHEKKRRLYRKVRVMKGVNYLHRVLPLAKMNLQKSKKKKDQAFVDSWLTNCEFKNWLTKVGANNQVTASCTICDKMVTCSKTGLKRHMGGNKHQKK